MNNFISSEKHPSFSPVDEDDIMLLDGEEALKVVRMIKEKYVQDHHARTISYLESKALWRTFVGNPRREVTRKSRNELIDYLYQFYKMEDISTSTIAEVFERCQNYRLTILNRSANTIERDRQAFERFFTEEFRKKMIANVTDDEISEFFNLRSQELCLKERALKDSLQLLNRVFDFALKREKIIKENPVVRIDLQNYYQNCDISMKSSDEKIFTSEEIQEIKDRVRMEMSRKSYDPVGYAILFSIETGVRVAEIPPLRWTDITEKGIHIHRQQRMIRIKGQGRTLKELPFTKNERRHPKGGRFFPKTEKITDILDAVQAKQEELGIKSEYIFCNADGTWLDKETYAQRLRRMCRRINLKITNNHAFRMSLNSNVFIPAGLPVTQRAYLLGHSVETNERFYSHMRTESLEDLKEVLNHLDQSTHTHSHTFITKFPVKKIPQSLAT